MSSFYSIRNLFSTAFTIQTLFLDNLEISAEIVKFCNTIPEYVQAEREYNKAAQELMELIGYERYSEFELALTNHLSNEVRAHYLFEIGRAHV